MGEEEEREAADEAAKGVVGSKKTANRAKRVKRAKRAVQKAVKKRAQKESESSCVSFVAIDLLHDPQALAEKLLQRMSKGGEPYQFRLLILHLLARIVGRNQIILLNLYPFLIKYIQPTQKDVTRVLAALVEASHSQVPPSDLRPTIQHIIQTFVSESQTPEVIEVGLNSIREVCVRAVNVLTEEELADLVDFRKFKHKGVAMSARSLINAYRELHPQLLHRSLRGKEAAMALSRGQVLEPVFGETQVSEQIDGLEVLAKKQARVEGGEVTNNPKGLMTDKVLSCDDFQAMRKMRLQKSIEIQLGRKRRLEEMSGSSSCSESDSDISESDLERGLPGRIADPISGAMLQGRPAKPRAKQQRIEHAKSGFDFKEHMNEKRASRKGGKTNKEHARNKPLKMVILGKKARAKNNMKAKDKMACLKSHIKTLKTKCKNKRRRG